MGVGGRRVVEEARGAVRAAVVDGGVSGRRAGHELRNAVGAEVVDRLSIGRVVGNAGAKEDQGIACSSLQRKRSRIRPKIEVVHLDTDADSHYAAAGAVEVGNVTVPNRRRVTRESAAPLRIGVVPRAGSCRSWIQTSAGPVKLSGSVPGQSDGANKHQKTARDWIESILHWDRGKWVPRLGFE